MIKLKNILNESKTFGDSVKYTDAGVPFRDGLTPELIKELEDYVKNQLKTVWRNQWKWKKWSPRSKSPRIINEGTRKAYLIAEVVVETHSKIMGKKYEAELFVEWKPSMNTPTIRYDSDLLANTLDPADVAPKVKKWFMELHPDDMPKDIKRFRSHDVPKSFKEPFEDDIVLSFWSGVDDDYDSYEITDVFEECYKLYYEEWQKLHPTFFQKVANKVKKVFSNEDIIQSTKLKDILKESTDTIHATYIERSGKLYNIKVNGKKVGATDIKKQYSIDIPYRYNRGTLDNIKQQFKKQGITFTYDDSMDVS